MRDRKGQHLDVFQAIRRAGLIRARVDGEMVEVTDTAAQAGEDQGRTSIEAVVDRISIREGIRPRLAESLDLALKLSGGGVLTLTESAAGWDEQFLSIHLSCPICGTGLPAIEPRTLQLQQPAWRLPGVPGAGLAAELQPELAFPTRISTAMRLEKPLLSIRTRFSARHAEVPACAARRVPCGSDGRSIADLSGISRLDLLTFFESATDRPGARGGRLATGRPRSWEDCSI